MASCTYEGDNIVLLQQTARRLFKLVKGAQKGKSVLTGNVAYIDTMHLTEKNCPVKDSSEFLDPLRQQEILVRWPQKLVFNTCQKLSQKMANGQSFGEAWNQLQVPLCKMAEAHCYYIMGIGFVKTVTEAPEKVQAILKQLCDLFILSTIYRNRADFLLDGYFTEFQVQILQDQIDSLVDELAKQAVPLVDAFGFSDKFLNSSLGRYDGNVYEALVNRTKGEPLNSSDVVSEAYKNHLRPLLKGEIWAKL